MVSAVLCAIKLCAAHVVHLTVCDPLRSADQQQIQYVTSKVSLVEAMHASLRETLSSLRTDVQHGNCSVILYSAAAIQQ